MVAPALPYGSQRRARGVPGTLSIGQRRARARARRARPVVATGRCCSCARTAGNAEPLARAVRKLRIEGHDVRAWSPAFGGDAHAGRVETSLMLALAPELVGAARPAGNIAPLAALMPRLRAGGVRAVGAERRARRRRRRVRRGGPRAARRARSPTSSRSSRERVDRLSRQTRHERPA